VYAVDADEPTQTAFRCDDSAVDTAITTQDKHFNDGDADIAFSRLRHLVSERSALLTQTCHL
jgi:hypothetical protein